MPTINLKLLIEKLNPICQRSLEAAAGLCLSRSHYNIEIEHWLVKLLEATDNDIAILLNNYGIDRNKLLRDIAVNLDRIKTGNAQAPALSQRIIDLTREAFLLATLEFSAEKIRSGYLLYAFLCEENSNRIARSLSTEFNKISVDMLRQELPKLIANSCENEIVKQTNTRNIKTPALDQFTINLTELARQGKIDGVIGREVEIRQLIDILMRRRQNNPILTGEPGVGKTAVVEGFALRVVQGDVPPVLRRVAVHTLDLGLLQAGAGIKGEFENRLKSVMQEVKASLHPVILFIDEAHTLIGAGAQAGQGDAANLLKPALARGELRTIAATTWAEYKKYFEQDAALARRFQVVKIEEPTEKVAITMLRGLTRNLEQHHGVRIIDEAVVAAVKLSMRYLHDRQLPDKAISVLDTACARVAINQATQVDAQVVAEIISAWTGIPLGKMLSHEIDKIINLEQCLQQRVMGQTHALRLIAKSIHTSRAQLSDPRKPLGVFLLVGPSGVGKTETALALAELLYGSEQTLTTINLSEFKEEHKVSLLLGSPPGYVGYGEGGILTEAVRRRPYSLVLLDEVEKAHPGVQDVFYQVFDKGLLRDGQGRDINFKNTVIILTSNVASDLISKYGNDSGSLANMDDLLAAIRPELLKFFRPAFLGRVTVIPYLPLNNALLQQIVSLQLQRIQQRVFTQYQTQLDYAQEIINYIVEKCQTTETGARNIEHLLAHHLLPDLSTEFLTALGNNKKIKSINIKIDQDRFAMDIDC